MRYPEEKIKAAILHPDLDVRDAASRYFATSTVPDPTLMPLAIEAIEKYGRTTAFSFTDFLRTYPQTDQTVDWVVAELSREIEGLPEDRYFHRLGMSRLLCHADIRLVFPRAEVIFATPHLDRKERHSLGERFTMAGWDADACWNALQQFCEINKDQQHFDELDFDHAFRIIEALALQPHEYEGQILSVLAEPLPELGHPRRWLAPLLAKLAGEEQIESAIPLLVGNLGHPDSFVSDQSMFALAQIGTEAVVAAVCERFPRASREFRRYATELLRKIHLDATVEGVLALLPQETDPAMRRELCRALLAHFSSEGIEPARKLLSQRELSPDLRDLRMSLIAACKIMDVRFPEFDAWHMEAQHDAEESQQQTQEVRKMAYEAGGDLAALVRKLRAEVARRKTETEILKAELSRGEQAYREQQRRQARLNSRQDHRGKQTEPVNAESKKVGRNDTCPCGSGKKFKHCCLRKPNDL